MRVILAEGAPLEIKACRTCRARIVWAETDAGNRMPVDVERTERGDLVLYTEMLPGGELLSGYQVKKASPEAREFLKGNLWISHFATCPQAAAHRKVG